MVWGEMSATWSLKRRSPNRSESRRPSRDVVAVDGERLQPSLALSRAGRAPSFRTRYLSATSAQPAHWQLVATHRMRLGGGMNGVLLRATVRRARTLGLTGRELLCCEATARDPLGPYSRGAPRDRSATRASQ